MDTRFLKLILVITAIRFILSLAFISDPALADVHALDIVPYGVLWQWTNPFYWVSWYPQLMVLLDIPITYVNYRLLSRGWFYAWLFTDFHWFTGFFSNVTVTWLAPYPIIGIVWTVFQKLPLGYSWTLNDGHVSCAFWCGGKWTLARGGRWVTYGIISGWSLLPTLLWIRNRKHKPRLNQVSSESSPLSSPVSS